MVDKIIIDNTVYRYGIIYMFTNKVNNKKYIGQTISEKNRYYSHFYNGAKECQYFHAAISKYGKDNFDYEVLYRSELFEDTKENKRLIKKTLNDKEQFFIKKYNTVDREKGYNITIGGDGTPGHKVSNNHKQKLHNLYIGTHYESKQKGIHRDNLNAVKANLRKINYYKHGVFMKQYESLKECYDDLKDEISSASIQRLLHNRGGKTLASVYKFEHVDKTKIKCTKKIYQFNEDYKVIKIWNSIHACVKTKQYTELAIKMAIKNNTIYENSYWNYNENWCPIKENKCDALF